MEMSEPDMFKQVFTRHTPLHFILFMMIFETIGCTAHGVKPFEQGNNRYQFDIVLNDGHQVSGEISTSSAIAKVIDLESGRGITSDPFSIRKGESKKITAVDSTTGTRLDVDVETDPAGTLSFRAVLKNGEQLIASESRTLQHILK